MTPTAIDTTGSIVLKTDATPASSRATPARKKPIATMVLMNAAAPVAHQPEASVGTLD
jgi:hypothetical protein